MNWAFLKACATTLCLMWMLPSICLGNCPVFQGALAFKPYLCEGENTDMVVDVVNQELGFVEWSLPNGETQPGFTISVFPDTNDPCSDILVYGYNLYCLADGSLIANGEVEVQVYMPIEINAITEEICNVAIDNPCNYDVSYVLNTDGPSPQSGNIASVGVTSGESGTVAFTLEDPDENRPDDCDITAAVYLLDCPVAPCPTVLEPPVVQVVCEGDVAIEPEFELANDNGQPVYWYRDITDINNPQGLVDWNQPIAYPATGDGCEPVDLPYFAVIECDDDGDGNLAWLDLSFIHTVRVFPPIDILMTEEECTVSLAYMCSNYDIYFEAISTGISNEMSGPFGSFDVDPGEVGSAIFYISDAIPNRPDACNFLELTGSFDCPLAPCPSSADPSETYYLCDGETLLLAEPNLQNDNGESIRWFRNVVDFNNPQTEFISGSAYAAAESWDPCQPHAETLHAYISCDTNGMGGFELVSLNYTAFVELYAEIAATVESGECYAEILTDCDYEISYTIQGGSLDGESGSGSIATIAAADNATVAFTIDSNLPNHPAECGTLSLSTAASCAPTPCPSSPSESTESFVCNGDVLQLPEAVLINDNGLPVEWYADSTGPSEPYEDGSVLDYPASGDGCNAAALVLHAFISCDENGDPTDGLDWIDLGLSYTINIFPAIDAILNETDCTASVTSSCDYSISYSVASDGGNNLNSGTGDNYSFAQAETGTVSFMINAIDPNHPAACNETVLMSNLSCPACTPAADPEGESIEICEGTELQTLNIVDTGDTYLWSSSSAFEDTLAMGTSYLPTALGSYFVKSYAASDDCESIGYLEIGISSVTAASSEFSYESNSFCVSSSVITPDITGVGGGEFSIDNGAVIDPATGSIQLQSTVGFTDYTVQYISPGDCNSSTSFSFTAYSDPEIEILAPESVCPGETFIVEALYDGNSPTASWDPGSATLVSGDLESISALELRFDQVGSEVISLRVEEGGCEATMQVPVQVLDLEVQASGGGALMLGQSTELDARVIDVDATETNFSWAPIEGLSCFDCPNPIAEPSQTTLYTVVVTSLAGCTTTASVSVVVNEERGIITANAFTPNEDGINDVFVPSGNGVEQILSFEVYDRWGKRMYQASNFSPGDGASAWDGKAAGEQLPMGTYVYAGQARYFDGSIEEYSGHVTIIR